MNVRKTRKGKEAWKGGGRKEWIRREKAKARHDSQSPVMNQVGNPAWFPLYIPSVCSCGGNNPAVTSDVALLWWFVRVT